MITVAPMEYYHDPAKNRHQSRPEAECRNLSSDVTTHHRAHYWRMAGVWEELAQQFYDLNTSDA
jgi:hypothetical protein